MSYWDRKLISRRQALRALGATGGTLERHPLEASDVGWFAEDRLPTPVIGLPRWGPSAFAALRGETHPTFFDVPRTPVWRRTEDHEEQHF